MATKGLGSPIPLHTGQRIGSSAKSILLECGARIPQTHARSRHWGGAESSLVNRLKVSLSPPTPTPRPPPGTFLKGCGFPNLLCDLAGALFICEREWIT